jgi:hypothetical protein
VVTTEDETFQIHQLANLPRHLRQPHPRQIQRLPLFCPRLLNLLECRLVSRPPRPNVFALLCRKKRELGMENDELRMENDELSASGGICRSGWLVRIDRAMIELADCAIGDSL